MYDILALSADPVQPLQRCKYVSRRRNFLCLIEALQTVKSDVYGLYLELCLLSWSICMKSRIDSRSQQIYYFLGVLLRVILFPQGNNALLRRFRSCRNRLLLLYRCSFYFIEYTVHLFVSLVYRQGSGPFSNTEAKSLSYIGITVSKAHLKRIEDTFLGESAP